jgi:hypothetical protein
MNSNKLLILESPDCMRLLDVRGWSCWMRALLNLIRELDESSVVDIFLLFSLTHLVKVE